MSIEEDIELLESVPSLRLLGRDALRILAIGAESRYIHDGVSLFAEGDDADSAYLVQVGSFDLIGSKNKLPTSVAGPGTLIGELALITESKRLTSAVAREPSSVARITRQLFLKMLEGYPDAAVRMRNAMAGRVSQTATDLTRVRNTLVQGPTRR